MAATNSHHHQEPPNASFMAAEPIKNSTAVATPTAAHPRVLRKPACYPNIDRADAPSAGCPSGLLEMR